MLLNEDTQMHRLMMMMVIILVNKSRLQLHSEYMLFSKNQIECKSLTQ